MRNLELFCSGYSFVINNARTIIFIIESCLERLGRERVVGIAGCLYIYFHIYDSMIC